MTLSFSAKNPSGVPGSAPRGENFLGVWELTDRVFPRERVVVVDVHGGRVVVTMSFLGWGADVLPGEPPRDGIGGSLRTRDRGCRRQLRPAVVCSVGSWPRRCVCRRVEPVERLLDVLTRGRVRFVSRAIRHLHHVGLGPLDALGALERESRLLRRVLRRFARFSRVDDVVPPGSLGTRLHAIARGGRGRHVGSTRLEARVPWFTAKRARGRARRARGVARGKRRRYFRFEKAHLETVGNNGKNRGEQSR